MPFLEAFIPLFVAIDPVGMIPIFLGVTGAATPADRRRLSATAVVAASAICLAFMFVGQALFGFLGITENDFKIAGGLILLVLAVLDIISYGKPAVDQSHLAGIVPLATPLMAGPATLTTLLVLAPLHGYLLTAGALLANFALLYACLLAASPLARLLGRDTMHALSKLVMILLAAIAVYFIRSGITAELATTP